jgi:hypothetical protein
MEKLSLIDFAFHSMSTSERCMDFCIYGELENSDICKDSLEKGAEVAFKSFKRSACKIKGYRWTPIQKPFMVREVFLDNHKSYRIQETIEKLQRRPIDLKRDNGIEQWLIYTPKARFLVTRCHHALTDLFGFLLWLKAQILQEEALEKPLKLQSFDGRPADQSPYSFRKGGQPLKGSHHPPSDKKKFKSFSLERLHSCKERFGVSYNDILSATIMKAASDLRDLSSPKHSAENKPLSLYMPTNIRQPGNLSFGNGSTRLKIYDHSQVREPLSKRAKWVREQRKWCRSHGLWALPTELGKLYHLPSFILRSLLKLHSKRPSADLGSFAFSHMEDTSLFAPLLNSFSSIHLVSQLYKESGIALAAMTIQDRTNVTITWDAQQFMAEQIDSFINRIKDIYESLSERQKEEKAPQRQGRQTAEALNY